MSILIQLVTIVLLIFFAIRPATRKPSLFAVSLFLVFSVFLVGTIYGPGVFESILAFAFIALIVPANFLVTVMANRSNAALGILGFLCALSALNISGSITAHHCMSYQAENSEVRKL